MRHFNLPRQKSVASIPVTTKALFSAIRRDTALDMAERSRTILRACRELKKAALLYKGIGFIRAGKPELAIQCLDALANRGYRRAFYPLARAHKRDPVHSVYWATRAAVCGSAKAVTFLADTHAIEFLPSHLRWHVEKYQQKIAVETEIWKLQKNKTARDESDKQRVYWLTLAASKNDYEACTRLSIVFDIGSFQVTGGRYKWEQCM